MNRGKGTYTEISVHGIFTYVLSNCIHISFVARSNAWPQIISLGSSVGSGLFIATGKALATGGPGTMFLAYLIVCTGVWSNLQSLGEMTIAFPVSGSFVNYAGRWVDPALAFGAGFAEWLGMSGSQSSNSLSSSLYVLPIDQGTGWIAVFAAEAEFFVVLIEYWTTAVPHAALSQLSSLSLLLSSKISN